MKNFNSNTHFLLILALAVLMTGFAAISTLRAQPGGIEQQQAQPTQVSLQDSLREAYSENKTLEDILHSIRSIDTARQNELIQWIITDRSVRSRVISALRKEGFFISPNSVAEMTVTQNPVYDDQGDLPLLRLVIQSVGLYGEPTLKRVLGPDLYSRIQSRQGYQYTLISTAPAQQNIQFVRLNASLFGGDIIFKSGFGFAMNVGDDWIGYPFWLPGTIGTYGLIRSGTTDFRLGLEWPLGQSGVAPFTISQGLQVRPRKLAGAMAFAAEVQQDLNMFPEESGKLHFGLEFRDAFTPNINSFPAYLGMTGPNGQYETYFQYPPPANGSLDPGPASSPNRPFIYYLALSTHGYVQYKMPDQVLRGAYIQLGGGMHSIQPVTVGSVQSDPQNLTQQDLVFWNRYNFFDPFVKLGYVHTGESGEDYGISVQYSNTLLTDGWFKLFDWLELEAKYSTVIGRDPYPWEWKDYVMVSPKLILNF